MYLGEFREEKYRKLLELYHGIEELNPSLYAEMVEQFGRKYRQQNLCKQKRNSDRNPYRLFP